MSQYLMMNGYGMYVWSSVLLAVVVMSLEARKAYQLKKNAISKYQLK